MRRPFAILALVSILLFTSSTQPALSAETPQTKPEAKSAFAMKTVRDFGAIGDGKTDDTEAIQRAVDAKTGDILFPRGVYLLSRPITVDLDRVGFTSIHGTGTATLRMTGAGPALKIIGTHQGSADPPSVKPNVYENQRTPIVEGIEIVGAHESADGIEAVGTMKLIVDRVTIREARDALRLVTRNRNVIVSNCHFYHNRRVGLYLDDCNLHQINVVGSHISYNPGGGIVVRRGNVRNLHIGTCDIEGNVVNILIDSDDGKTGAAAEVTITGCTLQHSGGPNSANVRFIGADAKEKPAWGHLTISGNVMSDVETNIDIQKAVDVVVTGNSLWKGYLYNLRVRDSRNVTIGPNTLGRNPRYKATHTHNGVVFEDCRQVTVSGLTVEKVWHTTAAMAFHRCRRVNVTGCTVVDYDSVGILFDQVVYGRISDCLVRDDRPDSKNTDAPIAVVGGHGCTVRDNLVSFPLRIDSDAALVEGNFILPKKQ